MRKLKSKVEICKLPSTTPVFLPRYREARKLPPSPRWSPLQEISRKGQALGRITLWIARAFPTRKWVSGVPFDKPLLDRFPSSSLSSFRLNRYGPCSLRYTVATTPQTRLVWSRKTISPTEYSNGARKHRVIRGVQSSLNTRPKHRASV